MVGLANILSNPQWRMNVCIRNEEIADSFSKDSFGDAVEAVYKSVLRD